MVEKAITVDDKRVTVDIDMEHERATVKEIQSERAAEVSNVAEELYGDAEYISAYEVRDIEEMDKVVVSVEFSEEADKFEKNNVFAGDRLKQFAEAGFAAIAAAPNTLWLKRAGDVYDS